MPWTVEVSTKWNREIDELLDAERRKFSEWRNRIERGNNHPTKAATDLGYEVKKLRGNQFELIVGSRARVSFTIVTEQQVARLVGVGHT